MFHDQDFSYIALRTYDTTTYDHHIDRRLSVAPWFDDLIDSADLLLWICIAMVVGPFVAYLIYPKIRWTLSSSIDISRLLCA